MGPCASGVKLCFSDTDCAADEICSSFYPDNFSFPGGGVEMKGVCAAGGVFTLGADAGAAEGGASLDGDVPCADACVESSAMDDVTSSMEAGDVTSD